MTYVANERLPNFLIVGAMKSGTTTVYRDLETQPRIFFPVHKEPHNLCYESVLSDEGRVQYASLFRGARAEQLCGEASTGYTKLPVRQGVVKRARQLLGPDLRIIYSVREPVARALSHHRHLYLSGFASPDFEETLRHTPDLIDVSRYAMQIEPWIEMFGPQLVYISQLETYSQDRQAGLKELCTFMGIEAQPELVEENVVFRSAEDKQKVPSWLAGPFRRIVTSHLYLYRLRPMLPDALIVRMKRALLSSPQEIRRPSPAVIDELIEGVRDDAERLRRFMGRSEPLWDFDSVRMKYVGADQPAGAAV